MRFAKVMALPVGAALAVAATGCGSSSNTSSSTTTSAATTAAKTVEPMFVGTVAGTNAYIGIITSSQQIIAYVCDGAGNKIGDHFQGNVPPGVTSVTLTSPDSSDTLMVNAGQTQLQNAITSGGTVAGTWKAGGTSHTFSAQAAHVPGALWTASDTAGGTTRTGSWIVLNDGSVRGSADLSKSGQTTTLGQSTGSKGSNATGQFTTANGNSGTTTTTNGNSGTTTTNGNSGTTTTNGNSGTTTTNGNPGTTTTNGNPALGTVIRAPDGTVVGTIDQQFIDAQNKFLQDLATQPTPQPQIQAVLPNIQVNVQTQNFAYTQTTLNIARVACPFGGHIDPGFPGECVG